ncbi:MAG: S1C family serine protease [Armatimonadota bacterium]|nr:S1C family serine protease [Armatimonadota bacterium]MDR7450750.1 S1C family serine protease [Armatimonadota bacterium]MDR7466106.1 S1C family serine protease [Armatimonadota bacterium]MDR7493857.1 S1C family serine protease [Armatimonadota bacterium]MDR7498982.1 S1C family serine protease [Armatimonadota bacterium]
MLVRRPLLALTAVFLLAMLAGFPAAPARAQYEDLIAQVKPAVVLIQVTHALGGRGHGSGFVYDPSGFILTNHHVVEGAAQITVRLQDGRTFPARVVDYVRRAEYSCPPQVARMVDAAVLKIDATDLKAIPLGDSSSLRQGQELLVLGYPGGVGTEEVSVTRGIVGALRSGWFQTDATMMPGNSGGPAVDRQGRAVGLVAFGTGQYLKIGGVIAINEVRAMAAAALSPDGPRTRQVLVSGREFVAAMEVGRRKTLRQTAEAPGMRTSVSEYSSEVTQVQEFAGALLATIRTGQDREMRELLDADGLFIVGISGDRHWKHSFREPWTLLSFPLCPGVGWRSQVGMQELSDGTIRQMTISARVEAVGETVTVPAGTFSGTVKIVEAYEIVDLSGRKPPIRQQETAWWAQGVGAVKSVTVDAATQQRWTDELVSSSTVAAAPPAPPPTPAPSPSAPTVPAPSAPGPSTEPGAPAARPPAPNDRVIVPGERVGAVRIGDPLDRLFETLGEVPTVSGSQRPGQPSGWIRYQWRNRVYAYVEKDRRLITEVGVWAPNPGEIAQPPFRMANGIGLGSTEGQVVAAFGRPPKRQEGARHVIYIYSPQGVAFFIGTNPGYAFNGQVYDIFVFPPGTY